MKAAVLTALAVAASAITGSVSSYDYPAEAPKFRNKKVVKAKVKAKAGRKASVKARKAR